MKKNICVFLFSLFFVFVVLADPALATNSATLKMQLLNTLTKTNDIGGNTESKTSYSKTWSLTDGEGANKAEGIYRDQRTLAASATEDLDLYGSLTDELGTTLNFSTIKVIVVYAATGNTNNVQMSVPASNGFSTWALAASDGVSVLPGGIAAFIAPDATGFVIDQWPSTPTDRLTFTNSAGSTAVTYDLIIIGELD